MSSAEERNLEREIALGLVQALASLLAPEGASRDLRAARDAAQLLTLPGLDRLIAALSPHAARPWPNEIRPVVERLQRVSARAADMGNVAEFRRADDDFGALAGEIVAMEWSALPWRGGTEGPPVATLSAAEMLSDLSLADDDSASVARRVRLTMPVAAAVRAALDWLEGRSGMRRPLELRSDASVLEIWCELRDAAGVRPAHEVLSSVDGNLGPPLTPSGEAHDRPWILRVPSFGPRPSYLMLEQGRLRLAVPWHAVLKLQVVRRDVIEARAARLGMSVLEPLAPLARRGPESPIAIVALGARRAWLVADRLVWRLAADPCEADPRGKEAGLERAVRTEDGEVFALAEPRRLLAGVPLPPPPRIPGTPPPAEAPGGPVAEPPHASPRSEHREPRAAVEPESAERPAVEQARAAPAPEPAPAPPETLTESSVTPLIARAEVEEGAAGPAPAEAAARRPTAAPAPGRKYARRVLLGEDSITARIFLTRLLEQQGFEVVGVERAVDLHLALADGPWALVCVDVELPDARGSQLLRGVRGRLPAEAAIVALARDDRDVAAARVAGVGLTLRKPVEPGALRRLLERLGSRTRRSE